MLIPNLIFVYHVIVASENLLRVAIAQTSEPSLKEYFEKHLEEERDHAKWLAEDLQSVGVDVAKTHVPLLAVQMAGSLYYLIYHAHPAALLGYMRMLEGWPNNKERLAAQAKPYPQELMRTVNHHIDHDPQHLKDLLTVIDSLPDHRKLIEDVAIMTRNYLCQAAKEIQAYAVPVLPGEMPCQAVVH